MARNFFRIDKGIRFVPQSSPPTSPQAGEAYYDSTLDAFRVYDGSAWITVDGDEVKTASNVGTGSQVFKQKTGVDLEFRSLVAGSNVTITQNANDITIAASGGELNFLQLANVSWNAENGTAGFATYKDAAQSRPQDGTGGSPSVTITTSNTNPLSGNSSLIITKPSGNLQGEGVSANFSIDRASRAKVLKVEFDYLVNSGTFNAGSNTADSDLIVYLYDVDASQLIEPSTFKLYSNASNIADKFSGYFQTSATSTNYRLIFHVATTNSSSWSLKVDNVIVSPSKYVYGTPITDWVQYTPTFNSGFTVGTGGSAFNKWYWRRVGDSVEIYGGFKFGTSGFSMGSGDLMVTLPSGLSFDYSKLAWGYDRIGNFDTYDTNNSNMREVGAVITNNGSPNTFYFAVRRDDGANNRVSATFPFTWGADDELFCRIEAPIQGWSSSVKMSDGYEGREIVGKFSKNTNQSIPNTTATDLTGFSVVFDTCSAFNPSTGTYTIPVSGYYRITAQATFDSNSNGERAIFYKINSNYFVLNARLHNGPNFAAVPGSTIVYCTAGQTVRVAAYQSSGGPLDVVSSFSWHQTVWSIERISSPQTIAMGEVVAGYAKNTSGQSIPTNVDTALVNWTVVSDTHAIFNPTTGVFTVNRAGFIDLVFSVSFPNNGNGIRSCHIYKNNTEFIGLDDATPSTGWDVSCKAIVSAYPVKAGDTFVFRTWQNSGTSLTINGGLNKTYLSWRIY